MQPKVSPLQDNTRHIFHSALRFFSGTMLSRITGLLRDMAMASAFGTHTSIAIFLVAFRFSHLFRRLFGEGAMQTAFIPQFEKIRKESPLQSCEFFRDLNVLISGFLSLLILLSMACMAGVLNWKLLSAENQELFFLTLLMFPSLLFICLFGLNAGLLQCEKHYFISSFAPCAFNGIWILGIIFLWHYSPSQAMPRLAGFVTLACLGQWLITLPTVWKILKKNGLTNPLKNLHVSSPHIRALLKPLFLGIVGVSASQVNNALDGIFALFADAEGPAYLWYAIRLQQLPIGLFGIALSGALLPPLSRSLGNNNLNQYKQFLEFALLRCLQLMLPVTAGIFLLGELSIQIIYGRGGFDQTSILGTANCLYGYGFGLIPTSLVLIIGPAFYAKGDYRTPTLASLASVMANIGLNAWMIMGLGLGAHSVAWATSLSGWFNFFILALYLQKEIGIYLSSLFWKNLSKFSLATGLGVGFLLGINFVWPLSPTASFLDQMVHLICSSSAFSIIFIPLGFLWTRSSVKDLAPSNSNKSLE
jgi:putative peptidoglycan lipid II flippase